MATPTKDILVTLYYGERDTAWEEDLIARCGGKLEIRWQHAHPVFEPMGPTSYDREALKDATMLYTYLPLPDGE